MGQYKHWERRGSCLYKTAANCKTWGAELLVKLLKINPKTAITRKCIPYAFKPWWKSESMAYFTNSSQTWSRAAADNNIFPLNSPFQITTGSQASKKAAVRYKHGILQHGRKPKHMPGKLTVWKSQFATASPGINFSLSSPQPQESWGEGSCTRQSLTAHEVCRMCDGLSRCSRRHSHWYQHLDYSGTKRPQLKSKTHCRRLNGWPCIHTLRKIIYFEEFTT